MARAIAIGIVILGAGCVPLPPPTTLPAESARDERPIARLGRWDGERFVEIAPGSIPPSHVRVIVHGWAPGWGLPGEGERELVAWNALDARGRPFEPWMRVLAGALAEDDPYSVVLAYSWLDDAATGRIPFAQRRAAAHTAQHGLLLARAIQDALEDGFFEGDGQIHLLGHSYGARVATEAALALDRAPAQLTLFDAPDAPVTWVTGSQMQLGELLRSLPLGWGADRTFVDNYVSMVGARYRDRDPSIGPLVEVSLAPPHSVFDYRHRHIYPMQFYAHTSGSGIGLGWSPLTPGARAPHPGCWEQPFGESTLHFGCSSL